MSSIGDLITDAFTEIRVARAGDVLAPEVMADGLSVLNRLFDFWNSKRRALYADQYVDYTLTPSLSPHTIGPGGTFNVTARPVEIEAIALNLGGGVFTPPLNNRSAGWYSALGAPNLTGSIPTDFYYKADWPLGAIYFFTIPTTAYAARVWTRKLLAAVVDTDTFTMPQGYQHAITMRLAVMLAPRYGQTASEDTKTAARMAEAQIFENNDDDPPRLTCDSGIPSASSGGRFDFLTRTPV